MEIVIVGVIVSVWIAFGCPDWMAGGSPYIVRAMLYPLFHASVFHLLTNALAASLVWRRRASLVELAVAYVISILVFPLSGRPIIGLSNVIYATVGMRTPAFTSAWWRSSSTLVFLGASIVMLFLPQFAGLSHLCAFALGVVYATLRRALEPTMRDAGRYL